MRPLPAFALGVAATLSASTAVAAGVATASSTGIIKACANKKTGELRISNRCTAAENSITWGVIGPRGPQGPAGARGLPGPAGENAESSLAVIRDAENAVVTGLLTIPECAVEDPPTDCHLSRVVEGELLPLHMGSGVYGYLIGSFDTATETFAPFPPVLTPSGMTSTFSGPVYSNEGCEGAPTGLGGGTASDYLPHRGGLLAVVRADGSRVDHGTFSGTLVTAATLYYWNTDDAACTELPRGFGAPMISQFVSATTPVALPAPLRLDAE